MKATRKANRKLARLSHYYDSSTMSRIIKRAREIAKERRATRLGANHLHLAMVELANEAKA